MKQKLFLLGLMLTAAFTASAQVLVGDMDDDGNITTVDVAQVVSTALGKTAKRYINAYQADNTSIVGTWTSSSKGSVTFNEDGTTTLGTGYTYKYRPMQGRIVVYNASGIVTSVLNAIEVESNYLVLSAGGESTYTYYFKGGQVSGIVISQSAIAGEIGQTYQLTATITPSDAAISTLTWSSSNESVATVSESGLVTVVGGGTATITASSQDGSGLSAACTVTVPIPVSSITLDKTTLILDMEDNNSYTLSATVLPENADNTSVTWESSDEDIAMVTSKGKVVAVDYGTATITCTAKDGSGVNATCAVTVTSSSDPNLLPGKFSVSATKQVQFTKSNLYWDGSAYKFEANQTDYPTSWNASHVSHFYWTNLTDYQSGNASYMPYASSYSYSSRSTTDKFWCGEDNPLTVEGTSGLYALTGSSSGEWYYLIKSRTNASTLYKSGVTVTNGGTSYSNCLIIAPDDFSGTLASSYTLDEVNSLGLVCLPAAGTRGGTSLSNSGNYGYYLSAAPYSSDSDYAYCLYFGTSFVSHPGGHRYGGVSLRLVRGL